MFAASTSSTRYTPQTDADPNLSMSVRELYSKVCQLRSAKTEVRVQPVGFLQILLPFEHPRRFFQPGEGYRLHVWVPELILPRDRREPIHDHVPDITSRVVHGVMQNLMYEAVPNPSGAFRIFGEKIGDYGTLCGGDARADLVLKSEQTVRAGETYFIPRGVPHAGFADESFTITLIRRDNLADSKQSRVFVSVDEGSDFCGRWQSPFDQNMCWQLVDFALCRALRSAD
jgi:hypothetical protein